MNLQRLGYFVAVAEELHFTRAARRLYLDQGALSAAVRRLEQELGLTLFTRSSRRVELTEHGQDLLPRARRLLAEADAFRAAVRHRRSVESGALTVGLLLGPMAAAELTPVILDAFRAAYPETDLRVRAVELHEQQGILADGVLDVMIARPPVPHPDVELHDLFVEPRVAELAPDHPLTAYDDIPVEMFEGHTFVQPDPRLHPAFADWARLVDVMGRDAVRAARFRAPENVWEQHAQAAAGVTAITVSSVARLVPSSQVVHRRIAGVPGSRVAVATRAGEDRSQVREFVRIANEAAAALAEELVPGSAVTTRAPSPGVPAPGRADAG